MDGAQLPEACAPALPLRTSVSLVSVFAVADARRREMYCKGDCGHAWHNLPAATEQP
ncbi:DUF5958 family protein [Streptomyces sp. NPDC058398]|uniref:DUF5958 family protein n=1 Tax=Streptomyces sp. NPDC058398 TaxID=3346479 RepID=UPI003665369C